VRRVFCLTPIDFKPIDLRNSLNLFAWPATEVHTPKHVSPVLTVPASYTSLNRNFGRFLTRRYGVTSQNTAFVWFWNIFRTTRYLKCCARHCVSLCQVRRHKTRAACRPALWLIVRMKQDGRGRHGARHVYVSLCNRLRIHIDVNISSSLRLTVEWSVWCINCTPRVKWPPRHVDFNDFFYITLKCVLN